MAEYRRGVARKRENDLWHSHPNCESYPTETFAIRQTKPLDDNFCAECKVLSQDIRARSAA